MEDFEQRIKEKGWVKFDAALPPERVDAIRTALDKVYETQRELQIKNGVAANLGGIVHCVLGFEDALDGFLADLPLYDYISRYFAKPFILNNYGGVINFPGQESYVRNPHRDVRDFTYDLRLMMNMLVMVDDFTVENGATHVLEGSHNALAPDEKEIFDERSIQLTGNAGDIILWDSNLLHAAGHNKTDKTRRALTLCFSRPYIKPSIDFLTAVPPDYFKNQSEFVHVLLGRDARPARDLNEFYQPPENRSYKMR